MAVYICMNCGNSIESTTHKERTRKYCSKQCRSEYLKTHRGSTEVLCEYCGKMFWEYNSNVHYNTENGKEYHRRFCSHAFRSKGYSGTNNPLFVGKFVNSHGYVKVRGELVPEAFKSMLRRDDSVLEHRLIMAQHLGRVLENWEVVHHLNGVKTDNWIENLELHSSHGHTGVTATENRKIAQLKRENAVLKRIIAELNNKLRKLER